MVRSTQAKALLFLQQVSKAGLYEAQLWNGNSSGKMSYFSLAKPPSPFSFYNGSLPPYICMFFTRHRYSYKKQNFLAAITHNQLPPANSSGVWWRELWEEERRLQDELGLSLFCSGLVSFLEELRCDLGCLERGMIKGAQLAALVCPHGMYFAGQES